VDVKLTIPDSIAQAIRLPEERLSNDLMYELATALYAHGLLGFGKARELAGVGKFEFGQMLGSRGIPRHYTHEEAEDDLDYADGR
jgi:predicted HTH domain antitoxin